MNHRDGSVEFLQNPRSVPSWRLVELVEVLHDLLKVELVDHVIAHRAFAVMILAVLQGHHRIAPRPRLGPTLS